MNSSVWAIWAAQGSNEEKKESISEQLLRRFFQLFVGKNDFLNLFKEATTQIIILNVKEVRAL